MNILVCTASCAFVHQITRNLEFDDACVTKVESLPLALVALERGSAFDAVLLDISSSDPEGLDGVRQMLSQPAAKCVVVIGNRPAREMAPAVLAMGAAGYLPKDLASDALVDAIRFIAMKPKAVSCRGAAA